MNFDSGSSSFHDPTQSIMEDFKELMFRAGIAVANWSNLTGLIDPGVSPKQKLHAQQQVTGTVFRSSLKWWAGAAVLDTLTILIILPLFNHWWSFDRSRSLSPFELALAFNSPLVKEVPSNAGAEGVIGQVGNARVSFGAVRHDASTSSEVQADSRSTSQVENTQDGHLRLRLSITRAEDVDTP
jgi:hypothetical protein